MDLHIVLLEPEIPQNTGSIGRTCVGLNATLHLIEPLGFSMDDKYMKRAGLDYWRHLRMEKHDDWTAFTAAHPNAPLWFYTTKAKRRHDEADYGARAYLVFGKETAGLPDALLTAHPNRCLRIPLKEEARSLNLSVAVGVAAYEAHRQAGFPGLAQDDPDHRLF